MPNGIASAIFGAMIQPVVVTPAIAMAAPGRISVSIARRLIVMCLFLCRGTKFGQKLLKPQHAAAVRLHVRVKLPECSGAPSEGNSVVDHRRWPDRDQSGVGQATRDTFISACHDDLTVAAL
jgi:hypothetical protein